MLSCEILSLELISNFTCMSLYMTCSSLLLAIFFFPCAHFSASFISPLFLSASSSVITPPLFLLTSPLFLPFLHPPLSFCPSVYVALSMLARASLFPLLVPGQLPHSSVLALVHPPPPSSSSSSSHFACVPGSGGLGTVYSPVA